MNNRNIYNPAFVRALFNEMSRTYGITNVISSFGFCKRWRNQCVAQIPIRPGMIVCDLMTGMGECWSPIHTALQSQGHIIALDFSPAMCRRARAQQHVWPEIAIDILEEDVLSNSIADASADCVVSTFGLKTLDPHQCEHLAYEIARILKPQGVFSLLEISVPQQLALRLPYMVYLKLIIPIMGKLLLGNPDNYRMLGIYTERFVSCASMADYLRAAGLQVTYQPLFFGCASVVYGEKP